MTDCLHVQVHTVLFKIHALAAIGVLEVEIGFTRSIVSLVETNFSHDADKNNNEAVSQEQR